MVKGILSGAVMQTVSKEMFNGSSGREMVNDSLARVENNREIPAGDRKVLRDLLGSVKELNERRAEEQTAAPACSLTCREPQIPRGAFPGIHRG